MGWLCSSLEASGRWGLCLSCHCVPGTWHVVGFYCVCHGWAGVQAKWSLGDVSHPVLLYSHHTVSLRVIWNWGYFCKSHDFMCRHLGLSIIVTFQRGKFAWSRCLLSMCQKPSSDLKAKCRPVVLHFSTPANPFYRKLFLMIINASYIYGKDLEDTEKYT